MSNTSPKDQFGFVFVTLARRWRRAIDHVLLDSGLTDATWSPLIHLAKTEGPITQRELAHRIGLDTSSLVRLLDQLASKGMVERQIDPNDRRARLLRLTELGQQEVARLSTYLSAVERELLSGFSDSEIASLLKNFEAIGRNAQAIIERP